MVDREKNDREMNDREKNLGIRVGDTIIHCNGMFTIVDIKREEGPEGMRLYIIAVDPDMADKEQRRNIEGEQIGSKITELVKKLAEKGLGGMEDR
jgi:hypothetical protein